MSMSGTSLCPWICRFSKHAYEYWLVWVGNYHKLRVSLFCTSCCWGRIWSRSVRPRSSRGLWPGSTQRSLSRITRTSGAPAGPRRAHWTHTAVAVEETHYCRLFKKMNIKTSQPSRTDLLLYSRCLYLPFYSSFVFWTRLCYCSYFFLERLSHKFLS